jgi:hypothetical protein
LNPDSARSNEVCTPEIPPPTTITAPVFSDIYAPPKFFFVDNSSMDDVQYTLPLASFFTVLRVIPVPNTSIDPPLTGPGPGRGPIPVGSDSLDK